MKLFKKVVQWFKNPYEAEMRANDAHFESMRKATAQRCDEARRKVEPDPELKASTAFYSSKTIKTMRTVRKGGTVTKTVEEREMTPEEEQQFDAAFKAMDDVFEISNQAFAAADRAFAASDAIFKDTK